MDPKNRDDEEDERPMFIERHRIALGIAAVVVVATVVIVFQNKLSSKGGSAHKSADIVSVRLPPPPPTPPPPAATPPPQEVMKQEQKMIEQSPVDEHEEKPKDEPPASAPISTGIKGDGAADGFGVGGGRGNGLIGGGSARHNSKWGWYAGLVQNSVSDALRRNSQIRNSALTLTVRIWSDPTGRVSRAKIVGSTNDPKTDQAIQDSLVGIQLKEAPPAGMPLPIVMRITAKRPNSL